MTDVLMDPGTMSEGARKRLNGILETLYAKAPTNSPAFTGSPTVNGHGILTDAGLWATSDFVTSYGNVSTAICYRATGRASDDASVIQFTNHAISVETGAWVVTSTGAGLYRNQNGTVFSWTAGRALTGAQSVEATTYLKNGSYTVAGVPSASTAGAGATIYVSNESGGAVPAFSDGTNWRRVTDRAIIS